MRKVALVIIFFFISFSALALPYRTIRKKCVEIGGEPTYETMTRKVEWFDGKKTVKTLRELYMEDGVLIVCGKSRGEKGYTIFYIGPYLRYEGTPDPDDADGSEQGQFGRETNRGEGFNDPSQWTSKTRPAISGE